MKGSLDHLIFDLRDKAQPTSKCKHRSMDSPIISRLFRQLFTHRACQSLRSHSELPFRIRDASHRQTRCMSSRTGDGRNTSRNESHWQQRMDILPLDMSEEYQRYPMVTADQLKGRRERPRRVKMFTRDFIEGRFRHWKLRTEADTARRFPIQPLIRIFPEAGGDIHARRAIRFQQHGRRAGIPPSLRATIHRV